MYLFTGIRSIICGLRKDLYAKFRITVLNAFVDDSGSGGDSPWFVLAGYIGTVEQWEQFETDWRSTLDADPKIEYFKMREAESLKDQFANFSPAERDAKIDSLIVSINRYALQAIYVRVLQKDYDDIVKGRLAPEWDSPYYFLFPGFIASIIGQERGRGTNEPVECIFDTSGSLEKRALRLYEPMIQPGNAWHGRVVNVHFRNDKQFLPLQAADLLAWQVRRFYCVKTESRRRHFDNALKCKRERYQKVLSRTELKTIIDTMQQRENEYKRAAGLPMDVPLWKLAQRERGQLAKKKKAAR